MCGFIRKEKCVLTWLNSNRHSQLQNLRKERLSYLDEIILSTLNLEELMPLEVDDEMILENSILPQPEQKVSLTTAFNIHSRLFWAALRSTHPGHFSDAERQSCSCIRASDPLSQLTHLQGRLHELKYMLDSIPSPLGQWAIAENDDASWLSNTPLEQRDIIKSQFASMRANIHVTHLWLQSIIYDQIDNLVQNKLNSASPSPDLPVAPTQPKLTWPEREDICRQLLHILYGIPAINLEANGHHLVSPVILFHSACLSIFITYLMSSHCFRPVKFVM